MTSLHAAVLHASDTKHEYSNSNLTKKETIPNVIEKRKEAEREREIGEKALRRPARNTTSRNGTPGIWIRRTDRRS